MQKIIIGASALTDRLCETLARLLSRDAGVLVASGGLIRQTGGRVEVIIVSAGAKTRIEDKDAVLLLPRDGELPIIDAPLTLVADSTRADWPRDFKGDFISCGRSAKDTLTLSSKTDDGAVVALMRQIRSLSGKVIEPCEFPVLCDDKDPFIAFAAVCVLLLADRLPMIVEKGSGAINLQL